MEAHTRQKLPSGGAKSILQSNPRYGMRTDQRPVLSGIGPQTKGNAIPDLYIKTIIKAFGPHADLYSDVLDVSPDAPPRLVRIAYFRRGREVLAEGGKDAMGKAPRNDVPSIVRTRFQAVSMAYEIVSTAAWKSAYLRDGLVYSSNSDARSEQSTGSRPSVRWNEQVEELVFEQAPEEVGFSGKKRRAGSGSKKTKLRMWFDAAGNGELDEHLRKLDAEAEPHFVADFWDSLEESIDGLLKLTADEEKPESPIEKTSTTTLPSKEARDRAEESSVASAASDDTPFDEHSTDEELSQANAQKDEDDSLVNILTNQLLGSPVQRTTSSAATSASGSPKTAGNTEGPQVSKDPNTFVSLATLSESPVPFSAVSPSLLREQQTPTPLHGQSDLFEVDSISFSDASSVRKQEASVPRTASASPLHPEDEDIFDGLEAPAAIPMKRSGSSGIAKLESISLQRSGSPTNASILSDLSESVAMRSHTRRAHVLSPPTTNHDDPSEPPSLSPAGLCLVPGGDKAGGIFCQPSISNALQKDGLASYFTAYMQSIIQGCETMGQNLTSETAWQDAVLGSSDGSGVDQVLSVVTQEWKRTPSWSASEVLSSPTSVVLETAKSFG